MNGVNVANGDKRYELVNEVNWVNWVNGVLFGVWIKLGEWGELGD